MLKQESAADRLAQTVANVYGEPLSIETWRESKPPQWIVEGLIARRGVTLISAKGGVGKSLLTTDLAVRLAAGDDNPWLDSFKVTEGPHRIAIVEAENGASRILRRIRELVMGDSFPPGIADAAVPSLKLFTAEALQNRGEVMDTMPALIAQHSLDLVIIDPLRAFLPNNVGDENDNLSVGRVIDNLVAVAKQSYAAILIVDHDNRAGGAARGAGSKQDSAEIVWQITAPDTNNNDYIELKALKQRDPGGPNRLAVTRIKGTLSEGLRPLRFETTEIREPGIPPNLSSLDDRIVSLVEKHHFSTDSGLSIRKIAEDLGVSKDKVQRRSKILEANQRIYRPPGGSLYPISAEQS